MSEKIIDLKDLRKLIRPDASHSDRRMIEQRFEQEASEQAAEDKQNALIQGSPALPEAQLVYNHAQGTVGVAVKGAKFICALPKEYGGKGLELIAVEGDKLGSSVLLAVEPGLPTLVINPQSGTTRRL